jgi:predicted glycosyltransferase
MCGYNTALDLLQTGVPALIVPFDAGSEVEQGIRAKALGRQSNITVLPSSDLTPETMLASLERAIASPPRHPLRDGMNGAAETVRIVEHLSGGRR